MTTVRFCPVRKTPDGNEMLDVDQGDFTLEGVKRRIAQYAQEYPTVARQYPVLRIVEVHIEEIATLETFSDVAQAVNS